MTTQTKTTWREVKLGDICRIKTGKTDSQDAVENGAYPLFDRSATIKRSDKFLFDTSAIILPGEGAEFTPRFYEGKFDLHQRVYAIYCDEEKRCDNLNLKFLYYFLFLNREYFAKTATGATVKSLRLPIIADCPVILPPFPTQQQVADVLSAYDDLIENNTRRIKILEQIAQAIYREWFVKPIDNGESLNEWEASTLGEHLMGLESGSRPKGGVGEIKEGVPSVGAENINGIGKHNYNREKYIAKEFFEKMKRGIVKDKDVALYKDGAYIGKSSYFRDGFPHKNFSVNEHVFLLRSSGQRITQNLLYLWLREPDTIHEIRATNANAAQPGINQPGVRGLKIMLPPQKMIENFDAKVEPILAFIINLAKQNNELSQARDLLLPKLVGGEIVVK